MIPSSRFIRLTNTMRRARNLQRQTYSIFKFFFWLT
ncbi:unnamed protein product [Paramecium sonneborni]|uniref:Uncharacterized protein n=1 Tax=Paramecium sonneborni TaxID=65129 RepID=A0A8S1R940_9CILI|nr:unnamed protein product [Paramecium sonneborni]